MEFTFPAPAAMQSQGTIRNGSLTGVDGGAGDSDTRILPVDPGILPDPGEASSHGRISVAQGAIQLQRNTSAYGADLEAPPNRIDRMTIVNRLDDHLDITAMGSFASNIPRGSGGLKLPEELAGEITPRPQQSVRYCPPILENGRVPQSGVTEINRPVVDPGPRGDNIVPNLPLPVSSNPPRFVRNRHGVWHTFLFDTILPMIYLYLLLRLPSVYFIRVARVFEASQLSQPDVNRLTTMASVRGQEGLDGAEVSGILEKFKHNWGVMIDLLIKEWKTLNVVSTLLLTAILTILQIQNTAADTVIRTLALLSLVCALMSLLYGCLYISHMVTIKEMHKAAYIAEEAQRSETPILWNIWVLLAMPAIWLSWSILFFIACILAFVWRGDNDANQTSPTSIPPHSTVGPHITITVFLFIGFVCFFMMLKTFRRIGNRMEKEWKKKVLEWENEEYHSQMGRPGSRSSVTSPEGPLSTNIYGLLLPPSFSSTPSVNAPYSSFTTLKLIHNMDDLPTSIHEIPAVLAGHDVHNDDWKLYIHDLSLAWTERFHINTSPGVQNRQDITVDLVNVWNIEYFLPRAVEVIFCLEVHDNPSASVAGTLQSQSSENGPLGEPIPPHLDEPAHQTYTLYLSYTPREAPPRVPESMIGSAREIPPWLHSVFIPAGTRTIQPLTGILSGSPNAPGVNRADLSTLGR